MEDCPPQSIHWIIFGHLTVCRKFRMRGLCVTCCGLTQMTVVVGVFLQEVLATHLDRIFLKHLTMPMALLWFLEPISW
ncbi:hypothetical protein AB205_0096650 [Aquarana catesbeiana]|uniref:Uncharacterized protein n=1 Tax=Aquarana catesbeiana TaxID=8400 RepID=A0A2G9SP52_AQUCT|nr:hypothetical protein AB205_0096650 [Aquarana catesbeiana]